MIGHLGARVSALLDGQLSAVEAEQAWAHVYACHACRDLVEREGWVKTRLAGLGTETGGAAPADLKGSLLSLTPGEQIMAQSRPGVGSGVRRGLGVAVLGGGALGAAVVGVLALGPGQGSAPADRRPPASRVEVPATGEAADGTTTERGPGGSALLPGGTVDPVAGPGRTVPAAVPEWVLQLIP